MSLCVLGNDDRSVELRKMYSDEKVEFESYEKADYIICPIPFTNDNVYINKENIKVDELIFSLKKNKKGIVLTGAINEKMKEKFEKNNARYIDLMNEDHLYLKNAILTSEGIINIIMNNSNESLAELNVLVIGYGRIGKSLTKMLRTFNSNVSVAVRREEVLNEVQNNNISAMYISNIGDNISNYDYIINTVPARVLNDRVLENVRKDSVVIDVASKPGGVDFMYAEKLGLKVLWELGIPSKYAKRTSAKYLKEEIDKIIL